MFEKQQQSTTGRGTVSMKQTSLIILSVLSFVIAAEGAQEKQSKKKETKEVTVTGEVIDVKCYIQGMMGGMGEDHKQCAIDCIKGGLPVGILDEQSQKVFVVAPKAGMKGANEELLPFVAQKVKMTGTVVEKGGQKILIYSKVEGVK
jgi:hypothetical protein